jgi:HSP20 family molecular chaperone IbpA
LSEKKVEEHTHKHRRSIWVQACPTCDCGCTDEGDPEIAHLVFEIPGVKKEDIHLHVVKDGLRFTAPRGEDVQYVSEYSFSCPALVDEADAKYEDGILTVEVPLECENPFKGSKPLAVK